ncbi:MAG: hypothetical protein OXF79_11565 [Chloroflexi bacterium]|nr:hypothetical protein [Chloroflexota bacterium]
MIVEIRDTAALSSLTTLNLRAYLQSRDWNNVGRWGNRATVHSKASGGRTWEILIPLSDAISDYAEFMGEAIGTLATAEQRSELDVFNDVTGAGADVIRITSLNGMGKEPLSLRQSADMLRDANDLLSAAARAVTKPQAAYRGSLSSEIAEYLSRIRPLPGYYQGYGLTLHSPVTPGIGPQPDLGDDDLYAPFPRRATIRLSEALQSANLAVNEASATSSLDTFEQAVSDGVSANLCDAVAKLAKNGHGVEIGVGWAMVRSAKGSSSNVRFTNNSAGILEEAARHFRQRLPSFDERVTAIVVRLDREPDEFDGRATIRPIGDDLPPRMQVEFEPVSYNAVISAFQNRSLLTLDGDIFPVANGHQLRNPRNIAITAE